MLRAEAIKILLEEPSLDDIKQELSEIKEMLSLLVSVVVISQKTAGQIADVSVNTIRNKVLRGEMDVLSATGSKLNYLTLKQTGELKPRRKPKRRK